MLIQKQSQIQKQMTVTDPTCMYAKQISKTKTSNGQDQNNIEIQNLNHKKKLKITTLCTNTRIQLTQGHHS